MYEVKLSKETSRSNPVRQYTKSSRLDFFIRQPKWFIFEGNLARDEDLEVYVNELAQIISGAKKFIHGVAGEFCSRVWNHRIIINALQTIDAKEITFICGPKFDIKNLDFIKIAKNKNLCLLHTTQRQEEHFRVTDKGIFIEGPHAEFQPERRAIFCKDSSITNDMYDLRFKEVAQKLKADGKLEPVDAKEILKKFEVRVYDKNITENYRIPNKDEIRAFFEATNDRKPTENELDGILNNNFN